MSSPDSNFIAFIEKQEISLKPGKDAPLDSDSVGLVSILYSLRTTFANFETIDYQCNTMIFSASKIPEVKEPGEKKPQTELRSQPSGKHRNPTFSATDRSVD